MNLQELVSQNPQLLMQLAQSAGIGTAEAKTGLEALLPALTQGLQRNTRNAGGLEALVKALAKGGHARVLDEPAAIADPSTRLDGNAILGHIFGSKDVSRNVAGHAAQSTGIDANILKTLLPVVASLAMGALSKQTQAGQSLRDAPSKPAAGGADILGGLLGGLFGGAASGRASANDSPMDDVLDLAKHFF